MKKEMESIQNKPRINKKSKRMAGKDRVSLSERSQKYIEERDAKTQKLREQLEQENHTEFKPKINAKSRNMNRSIHEMMAWKQKAELKKEANRIIAKVEEDKELRRSMKPKINKRSQRLARRRARENDDLGNSVGDRLNSVAKKRRDKMERLREEERKRIEAQRKPKLSKRSANYKRREDGHRNAADRLYFSAQQTEMKKQYAKEREHYLQTPSFVPKINKNSRLMAEGKLRASASRGAARLMKMKGAALDEEEDEYAASSSRKKKMKKKIRVEDRLAQKAKEYKQRQQRRVELLDKQTKDMSCKVVTNRRSEFLAGDRDSSSTLHRSIGNVRPSTISEMRKDCTFSPALIKKQYTKNEVNVAAKTTNKTKKNTKINGVGAAKVFERNQKWLEKRREKQEHKRTEKLKSSAEKCTFRPKINVGSGVKSKVSIAERSREWLQAKQAKDQKKRSEKESEVLRECTFRPNRIGGAMASTVVKTKQVSPSGGDDDDDDDDGDLWNYYETEDGYVYSHNPKTGETRWAEEHEVKFHEKKSESSLSCNGSIEPEALDRAFQRVLHV